MKHLSYPFALTPRSRFFLSIFCLSPSLLSPHRNTGPIVVPAAYYKLTAPPSPLGSINMQIPLMENSPRLPARAPLCPAYS